MPVLTNPKHELFAQGLAMGMSAVDAHEAAGYKRDDGNASKWAAKPEVQARVQEITGRVAAKTEVTIESLITEMEEVRVAAAADRQHAAVVSAITAKAKLAGLWVEKRENLNRNADPDILSDAEVNERIAIIKAALRRIEAADIPGETARDPSHVH
jgi:uncharacterized small protein (DUF1192 family)